MGAPRFYCPYEFEIGQRLELSATAGHHAGRVLRLRVGDEVTVFNGQGGEYESRIIHIQKEEVRVEIAQRKDVTRESPLFLTLAQSVLSNEKMDFTLQKAVELGVNVIQPILSERGVVRLTQDKIPRKIEHWQKVVISACEQCGRNYVPKVNPPASLANWLSTVKDSINVALSPYANAKLRDLPGSEHKMNLIIGPEGGFSENEVAILQSIQCKFVQIGPRILRTETAALTAIAALQTIWGDF